MPTSLKRRGQLYGALAAFTFAFYALINRYVYTNYEVKPLKYTVTFMLCGSLFAALSFFYEQIATERRIERNQINKTLINGVLAAIGLGIFVFGQSYTTAANASLLAATTTIVTIIFSHFMLSDDLSKRQIFWAIIMFTGLYIAIIGFQRYEPNTGDLLILAACIILGFTNTFSKTLMKNQSSITISDIRLLTGGVLFAIIGLLIYGGGFIVTNAGPWPLIAGFFFWATIRSFYTSVALINPNKAIILANSHAILTPVLGLLLLSEPYGWAKMIGSFFVVISIYFVTTAK